MIRNYSKHKFGNQEIISLTVHDDVPTEPKNDETSDPDDEWDEDEKAKPEPRVLLKGRFKITDLPGDAGYRGKWIQYYNNVDSIIFGMELNMYRRATHIM